MKREFTCATCNKNFEIEADKFIPGVSGDLYTNDGGHIRYVDPTTEHICPRCVSRWYDDFLEQLGETEKGGV